MNREDLILEKRLMEYLKETSDIFSLEAMNKFWEEQEKKIKPLTVGECDNVIPLTVGELDHIIPFALDGYTSKYKMFDPEESKIFWDDYFKRNKPKKEYNKLDLFHMSTAWILSQESSCISNRVACVIVKDNRIISSGYNGTKTGHKNCCDHAKEMGWVTKDGYLNKDHRLEHREWSNVNEYHAEQNAIDNATRMGTSLDGSTIFVNVSPCLECCKRITNIGIERVVYSVEYDNANSEWKERLEDHGVEVEQISIEELEEQGLLNFDNIEYFMVK